MRLPQNFGRWLITLAMSEFSPEMVQRIHDRVPVILRNWRNLFTTGEINGVSITLTNSNLESFRFPVSTGLPRLRAGKLFLYCENIWT